MEVSGINSILTMIVNESIDLQKKFLKVGTEQVVQAQEDVVVAEAFQQQGLDIYA